MADTTTWTFTDSDEGWTFRDESTGTGAFSTLTYDAVAEALEQNAFVPAASNRLSRGWALSPEVAAAIVNGDTIAMDISELTGPSLTNTTRRVKAVYTDASEENASVSGSQAAMTVTLTMTVSKTLDHIELVAVEVGTGAGATSFDMFCDILEVRLTTATPLPVPIGGAGEKPLEIDLDLAGGAKRWITFWDAGAIRLREYNSSLVAQTTASFTTGTVIADINNRTFYMSPYAPPFFGTSGLDDIIYVFGRWDDGNVQHIHKSTDGASSFSDIGDSATWLTGWVGAFFADDTNTLYAFVNGASRALYRSTDGGSNWTSLSSLPFDVDPGGMTIHPDGRILISNRAAGAQTAAYSIAPNYPSWVDATGTPSFPSSTPGSGSNAIIWVT